MAIERAMFQISKASANGKKFFHTRYISWSYRKRGYEARTQRKVIDNKAVFNIRLIVVRSGIIGLCSAPKNRTADNVFINKMLEYSARKNKAKGPPAYSTLNPETSSDSPSVKSNGDRLVSARVDTYHIAAKGQAGNRSQVVSCAILNVLRSNPPARITTDKRINPRLTSYEIVCATARMPPSRAYFEFEAHPEPKIEYTARLDKARIKRSPRFIFTIGFGIGIGAHIVRAMVKAIMGVIIKRMGDEADGRIGSLMNNLIPSAIG